MNFGFRSRETGLDEHTAISSENFTARRACLSGDLGKTAGIESGDQTRGKEREPRKREATRERHSEIMYGSRHTGLLDSGDSLPRKRAFYGLTTRQ